MGDSLLSQLKLTGFEIVEEFPGRTEDGAKAKSVPITGN